MVMMDTHPGCTPLGTVSCPVLPACAAASMARTSAEMPPVPEVAQKEAKRRAPFSSTAYTCPARLPLTHAFRMGKQKVNNARMAAKAKAEAEKAAAEKKEA